jgi:hypothetical protein
MLTARLWSQILAYPHGGLLSLIALSVGIGISVGLGTILLAMAYAIECPNDSAEAELLNDYHSHRSKELNGMPSGGSKGSSIESGKGNVRVSALQCGQATGAVLVIVLWILIKSTGQRSAHYVESRTTVMNGGRMEMMLAAAGCILGAYICARACAGRFDSTETDEADAEADGQVVKVVRPFAVALMLNSLCSSVLFPRLLDTAPSHWGLRPDWLASELTLLYALADLAGRAFSKEFVAFCQSKAAIRDWQRSQGARTAIWVSTIRGVFISSFILLAVACGWEDDSLFIFYVLFTGLSNGILVVGCLQQGACALNSVELRAKSNGPYLVCASLLGVGDALGCVIGFTLASGIWV